MADDSDDDVDRGMDQSKEAASRLKHSFIQSLTTRQYLDLKDGKVPPDLAPLQVEALQAIQMVPKLEQMRDKLKQVKADVEWGLKQARKAVGFRGVGPDQPDQTKTSADQREGEAFARAIKPRRKRRGLDRILNGAGCD